MRSLGLLLIAFPLAVAAPLVAQDKPELAKWDNHESLRSPETATADWKARGKDSKLEITAKGLLLLGDSGMVSRFRLADGGRIKFVYTTSNRNAIVRLCGKELKAKAPDHKGFQVYVFEVARRGRAVVWGVTVTDLTGRPIGKPVKADAIQIDADQVDKPARVVFASEPVRGRGDSNSVANIRFRSIVVSGPVVPADADKSAK
jgi:hypothetical protein